MSTVYVVGAGLAGLSAAVALAEKGVSVELIEGAPQAGGRCRSYFDPVLEQVIDNGNHLVLSGNHDLHTYLRAIGSENALVGPNRAEFDFADVRTGERWKIRPNESAVAWWLFAAARRVPQTRPRDYLALLQLMIAAPGERIGEVIRCEGALWERLLEPLLLAVLNTQPKSASAKLAGAVIRESLARGGRAYHPRIAHPTLSAAFVDPALVTMKRQGANVRLGQRVRALVFDQSQATGLQLPDSVVELGERDVIILAVPPWVATELVPGLVAPDQHCAIVNAHFRIAPPGGTPLLTGVIGGSAEWIFAFPDRISITVSGADAIVEKDREELAQTFWSDVARVLNLPAALPPWQIVKERRATFAATPEQVALRPAAVTRWPNLLLAGDWTDTGLPATLEGAVRSGQKAARLALSRISG